MLSPLKMVFWSIGENHCSRIIPENIGENLICKKYELGFLQLLLLWKIHVSLPGNLKNDTQYFVKNHFKVFMKIEINLLWNKLMKRFLKKLVSLPVLCFERILLKYQ